MVKPSDVGNAARKRFVEFLRVPYWPEKERQELGVGVERALEPTRMIMDELAREPLRLYRELWYTGRAFEAQSYVDVKRVPADSSYSGRLILQWAHLPGRGRCLGDLQVALEAWANPRHLNVSWIFDLALETLSDWCEIPQTLEARSWASPPTMAIFPVKTYRVPWWDRHDSFADFRQRARAELLDQFEEDIRKTKEEAREYGWSLAPGGHQTNAYVWTVRTHVLDEPISRVAEEGGFHPKSVTESVDRLVASLELPPRPRRTGRPGGSRDRHRAAPERG